MKIKYLILMIGIISCTVLSCTNVKEYQKSRVNDTDMELAPGKIQKTELSFQLYREGASGANGGRTGGGCGCN